MKVRNLYEVERKEVHKGTVSAWNLFGREDFQSSVLFFNDNLVESGITTEPHEHQGIEEVYYIINGKGKARVGEEEREIREGDAIYIPPGEVHSLTNMGSHPLRFICLGAEIK